MSTPPPVWPPQPGVPSPYGAPRSSGNATVVLVLGILSIVLGGFGLILGPIAWIMGNSALGSGTLDPSQAGLAKAGRLCGIIGTTISVAVIVIYLVAFSAFAPGLPHPAPVQSAP